MRLRLFGLLFVDWIFKKKKTFPNRIALQLLGGVFCYLSRTKRKSRQKFFTQKKDQEKKNSVNQIIKKKILFLNWISKKKKLGTEIECISILSFCEEEMKILAIFLRHANLKRKKISRKQNFSESPEYFKWENLFRSLSGFWEKNCDTYLYHPSRNLYRFFLKVILIFLIGLWDPKWKIFNRKPEGNLESCSAVGDQKKTWSSKIAFFI